MVDKAEHGHTVVLAALAHQLQDVPVALAVVVRIPETVLTVVHVVMAVLAQAGKDIQADQVYALMQILKILTKVVVVADQVVAVDPHQTAVKITVDHLEAIIFKAAQDACQTS